MNLTEKERSLRILWTSVIGCNVLLAHPLFQHPVVAKVLDVSESGKVKIRIPTFEEWEDMDFNNVIVILSELAPLTNNYIKAEQYRLKTQEEKVG